MSLTVTITQFSAYVTASENPDLHGIANYLYALCAPYNLEAAIISGAGGGGSISPVNPSSPPSIVDFYVSDTTPIVTGGNSAYFTQFKGYNVIFFRNGRSESTTNNGVDTYFSWNKVTGLFTCYGDAQEDELFQIIPVL